LIRSNAAVPAAAWLPAPVRARRDPLAAVLDGLLPVFRPAGFDVVVRDALSCDFVAGLYLVSNWNLSSKLKVDSCSTEYRLGSVSRQRVLKIDNGVKNLRHSLA
jgi:hypothetical protein